MSLFAELKRRNVVRMAVLYAVSSWLVLQVADVLSGLFALPDWTLRFVGFLLLLGLPFALIFSWVYELTPEGLKRESEVDRSASITGTTARRLNWVTVVLVGLAVGFLLVDRFVLAPGSDTTDSVPARSIAESAEKLPDDPVAETNGRLSERQSIAVLPFVNMSDDESNEFFSDGVSEEILNTLARIPNLKVAARTSAFQFKGRNQDIASIGQALSVAHVLEGSVRKAGNRVRVTAQLVKVDDGFNLWSESYDRNLDDIFAIQDEIASEIARALKTMLSLNTSPTDNLTGTNSIAAYEKYLEGLQQWYLRETKTLRNAERLFRESIEIDPNFAKAWAGLAMTYAVIASYTGEPEADYHPRARDAANRALSIDNSNVEALAALVNLPGNLEERTRAFEAAIAINPSSANAYQWYANSVIGALPLDEVIDLLKKASELDPRSRIILHNYANVMIPAGRFDESLAILEQGLTWAPDFNEHLELVFLIHLIRKDVAAARRAGILLASSLGKSPESVEVYLALLGEAEAQEQAVSAVLSWPRGARRDTGEAPLLYDWSMVQLLAHLGLPDAAETFLKYAGPRFPSSLRQTLADRALNEFNCRPAVLEVYQAIYSEMLLSCERG